MDRNPQSLNYCAKILHYKVNSQCLLMGLCVTKKAEVGDMHYTLKIKRYDD